jgi:hypothetical protein
MTAPELKSYPHFTALERLGCSRLQIAVYGVLAAFGARGYVTPSMHELASAVGYGEARRAREAVQALEGKRLVRRERAGRRNRYDLLGPTLEMNGEKTCE